MVHLTNVKNFNKLIFQIKFKLQKIQYSLDVAIYIQLYFHKMYKKFKKMLLDLVKNQIVFQFKIKTYKLIIKHFKILNLLDSHNNHNSMILVLLLILQNVQILNKIIQKLLMVLRCALILKMLNSLLLLIKQRFMQKNVHNNLFMY